MVVPVDGALVVVPDEIGAHAHLSVGSGSPSSYQCKYPAGQVQQNGVEMGVLVVVVTLGACVVTVGALVVVGLEEILTHAH